MPDGRKLLTLNDAADFITKLPKKESDLPEWQAAIEVLMLCMDWSAGRCGEMEAGAFVIPMRAV